MDYQLKALDSNMGDDEYQMLQCIGREEYGMPNPVKGMTFAQYEEWLTQESARSLGLAFQDQPRETTYFLYADGVPVGFGVIRHAYDEYSERVLGHGSLRYAISTRERGKGHGSMLFGLLLEKCREFGYRSINLFPRKDNERSISVMKSHGGIVLGSFDKDRYQVRISISSGSEGD